jgi:hypothetical protein
MGAPGGRISSGRGVVSSAEADPTKVKFGPFDKSVFDQCQLWRETSDIRRWLLLTGMPVAGGLSFRRPGHCNISQELTSNISMHRYILLFVACLISCKKSADVSPPVAPPPPATTPTSTSASANTSTRPILRAIELHYGIYLARHELHITVSPDGLLRSVRTENKSYGGNDIDPKNERVEIREGRLTPGQMAELARLFANWDALSSKPYTGVADGGEGSIRYGDKTVSGGTAAPKQFVDARVWLRDVGEAMPVVKP